MKAKVSILAGTLLLCTSCLNSEQFETPEPETTTPVRVHVNAFSFSQEDFPGGLTRATQTPGAYSDVKAIDLAIFSGTKLVYSDTQLRLDASNYTTFGEFECQLPIDSYTMVAVARNVTAGDKFEITSPTPAAYTTERARETFCSVQNIKVEGDKPVDVTPQMNRVMAKFRLVSTDAVPAGVAKIRTTYAAGSRSFNPTTGLATDNKGFVVTNTGTPSTGGILDVHSFLFLNTDEQTVDVTVEVLDAADKVLITKHLGDVHFKRNQVTKATGVVFIPGTSTFSFMLNTDWLPEEEIHF